MTSLFRFIRGWKQPSPFAVYRVRIASSGSMLGKVAGALFAGWVAHRCLKGTHIPSTSLANANKVFKEDCDRTRNDCVLLKDGALYNANQSYELETILLKRDFKDIVVVSQDDASTGGLDVKAVVYKHLQQEDEDYGDKIVYCNASTVTSGSDLVFMLREAMGNSGSEHISFSQVVAALLRVEGLVRTNPEDEMKQLLEYITEVAKSNRAHFKVVFFLDGFENLTELDEEGQRLVQVLVKYMSHWSKSNTVQCMVTSSGPEPLLSFLSPLECGVRILDPEI